MFRFVLVPVTACDLICCAELEGLQPDNAGHNPGNSKKAKCNLNFITKTIYPYKIKMSIGMSCPLRRASKKSFQPTCRIGQK